jgi:hypothetical protein
MDKKKSDRAAHCRIDHAFILFSVPRFFFTLRSSTWLGLLEIGRIEPSEERNEERGCEKKEIRHRRSPLELSLIVSGLVIQVSACVDTPVFILYYSFLSARYSLYHTSPVQ